MIEIIQLIEIIQIYIGTDVIYIQATISICILIGWEHVNLSQSSAISPLQKSEITLWVQNGEIKCKTMKLKMIESFNKMNEPRQTNWWTKNIQRLELIT